MTDRKFSAFIRGVKLTAQIRLLPDQDQAAKLLATLEQFNAGANFVAGAAFERRIVNKLLLQKHCYAQLREQFGLSSQMACLCVHRVAEVYKRDRSRRPKFRPHAAMSCDPRAYSFKGLDRVSVRLCCND